MSELKIGSVVRAPWGRGYTLWLVERLDGERHVMARRYQITLCPPTDPAPTLQ